MHGFTCGIGDLLLVPKAEKQRRHKLHKTEKLGDGINAQYVGIDEDAGTIGNDIDKKIAKACLMSSFRLNSECR
jgi:hypothetical protein